MPFLAGDLGTEHRLRDGDRREDAARLLDSSQVWLQEQEARVQPL